MQSNEPAAPAAASPPPRRVPTQARSRERVERMLASATTLIAQKGSDALRMSEVAELAGVSIGSLYQFFPDKPSLIRTLAERYNAEGVACVRAELATVTSEAELRAALDRVVDGYYEMFLAEPVMRDLWWATQADKSLQDVDEADMQAHTMLLRDVLVRLRPDRDPAELATLALLTMQLVATAVRLAISVDRGQGDAIVATFKRMLPSDLPGTLG
ncbi:MAG TPA: TetR/AcrR family transcriptional regulator [Longimicrobium sp.]|nr:TetR/AcrR family transcriptional regulator [Longimicrobium sp.]